MELSIDVLKLILPELLITHFDLTAHGFHKEIVVQDFPLRGKSVFLHIKRRRWLDKRTNQIVQRDWDLVAQGTRMTIEFAAFLKVLGQYQS